jgi:hypothetical protein
MCLFICHGTIHKNSPPRAPRSRYTRRGERRGPCELHAPQPRHRACGTGGTRRGPLGRRYANERDGRGGFVRVETEKKVIIDYVQIEVYAR